MTHTQFQKTVQEVDQQVGPYKGINLFMVECKKWFRVISLETIPNIRNTIIVRTQEGSEMPILTHVVPGDYVFIER